MECSLDVLIGEYRLDSKGYINECTLGNISKGNLQILAKYRRRVSRKYFEDTSEVSSKLLGKYTRK